MSDDGLDEDPHEILKISPDTSDDVVKAVAHRKSADVHPDSDSPDTEEYVRIQKAKDALLEG
ncbi:hypothetical protein [Haloterrigena turkmenica]|uniref:hypothetical protein n=1 Tax=Haloterrigena turkmenica TaxID=62320 RepID=UPI0006778AD5|nr:hypothetical protein [Haloterrigena turkmenica]